MGRLICSHPTYLETKRGMAVDSEIMLKDQLCHAIYRQRRMREGLKKHCIFM